MVLDVRHVRFSKLGYVTVTNGVTIENMCSRCIWYRMICFSKLDYIYHIGYYLECISTKGVVACISVLE